MKAAIFEGPGKIVVKEVPDPAIQNPDEVISLKLLMRASAGPTCGSVEVSAP